MLASKAVETASGFCVRSVCFVVVFVTCEHNTTEVNVGKILVDRLVSISLLPVWPAPAGWGAAAWRHDVGACAKAALRSAGVAVGVADVLALVGLVGAAALARVEQLLHL